MELSRRSYVKGSLLVLLFPFLLDGIDSGASQVSEEIRLILNKYLGTNDFTNDDLHAFIEHLNDEDRAYEKPEYVFGKAEKSVTKKEIEEYIVEEFLLTSKFGESLIKNIRVTI